MKVRIMQPEDYEEIYDLWISCSGMGLNSVDDSKDGIAKFLCRNPETCFVAEENAHIIGTILAGNDGRRGYIYHTAVSPCSRHNGVAAALVERVMAAFEKLGISKVSLVVFEKNEDGNAFWQEMGFSKRNDLVYRDKPIAEFIRIDT